MKVVIALGSNLGDSTSILNQAITALSEFITNSRTSSFHTTAPVGGPEQPDYLNAIFIGETELPPLELLKKLQSLEAGAGRVREVRWGARTLDLDLIAYGELQLESDELTIPHPRAHERAFVLAPWHEIDPEGELVGYGPIEGLLANLEV
jgi:2-amino-4-hydroxy-6-hydroxymethyldihydropteridine diphosphokinase